MVGVPMLLVGSEFGWRVSGFLDLLGRTHPVGVVEVRSLFDEPARSGVRLPDITDTILRAADRRGFEQVVLWGYSGDVGPALVTACLSSRVAGVVVGGSPIPPCVDDFVSPPPSRLDEEIQTWCRDAPGLLAKLAIPKLLFFGSNDNFGGFAFAQRIRASSELLAEMGFAVLELPGAGHGNALGRGDHIVGWALDRLRSGG